MIKTRSILLFVGLMAISPFNANLSADEPSPTETKLREALRSTMLQMRDAQTQVVTLQEAQTESDKEKANLQAKVDALTAQVKALTDQDAADKADGAKALADQKQAGDDLATGMVDTLSVQINLLGKVGVDDKTPLTKAIGDMKIKNPDLARALDQYQTDIQLWKTGYYQYVQFAANVEAARAKLAAQNIMLQRLVADREAKNLELYTTGNEILTRYENFSLGDALSAKEPFVGATRVKLQELVQDYKDKLLASKLRMGQAPAPVAGTPTQATSVSSTASVQP